jgi:hypothetical protein
MDGSGNQKVSEEEKIRIMQDIEKKTEKMVIVATNSGLIYNPINITCHLSKVNNIWW